MATPRDNTPTIQAPAAWWRCLQALRGTNFQYLTEKDVPAKDLTGQWILITGANNGIGYEAAKCFSKWGANLVLACREPPHWEKHPGLVAEECETLAKVAGHTSSIEWWEIDMAHLASVDRLAQRWLSTGRPLDILCNNAGTASRPSKEKTLLTKDGFEFIHQVNFLSHVLLTIRLLPSLAQSSEPRVVCTTSCHHFLSQFDLEHFNGGPAMKGNPYGNNKLYFQMWLTELQQRLLGNDKYKHITINGVNPGYVNTGIWNSAAPQHKDTWLDTLIKYLAHTLAITPQQGSLAIIYAATSEEFGPDPKTQGVGSNNGRGGGKYINRIWEAEPMPHCNDAPSRLMLWSKLCDNLSLDKMRQL